MSRLKMKIIPVPVRSDNYAYLLVDEQTKEAAAVDIYDVPKVIAKAEAENVKITSLLTTHHHNDHSGGNDAFASQYPGIKIYGGSSRCPSMTDEVKDGDILKVGANVTIKYMHKALSYLGTLPDDTVTYPGHEYTASNFKFGASIEPENEAIKKGIKLAEDNKITTGLTTIGDEKQFNVFMRLDNEAVKKATGESMPDSITDKLRTMKNNS
ncbi:Cytoplasmic glyoxalase II [Tulasnella sp. 424]|nr:Cytoplasmic glyoxalase II [Tulasnella sp. 424]KAG8981874.1 Cytoplasmic glyoxalase II [Tulasnella sp. 425]